MTIQSSQLESYYLYCYLIAILQLIGKRKSLQRPNCFETNNQRFISFPHCNSTETSQNTTFFGPIVKSLEDNQNLLKSLLGSLLHLDEEVTQLRHELPLFTTSVVLHHGQVSGSSDLQGFEVMRGKKRKRYRNLFKRQQFFI